MKLNLILEAFRSKHYVPVKHVGNILVLKLSDPLKVNHLGKIHTTDVICYNTATNKFSGGMTEPNGDVKIPPDFAFVFKPERVRGSTNTGVKMFVEWLNSKGFFSQHQIRTGEDKFIPKIDVEEKQPIIASEKKESKIKFKNYSNLPSIELQKQIILKHAEKSSESKIFICRWDYKHEPHEKTKKNTSATKPVYEEKSGFYPMEMIDMRDYSWNITDKQFMQELTGKIVAKKIIGNKVFLWTAGESGVFCGATFVVIGEQIRKATIGSYYYNQTDGVEYIGVAGPKLDIEDIKTNDTKKDPSEIEKSQRFAKVEFDTDQEIRDFLEKREKEKQEQAAIDAMLKASREQAAAKKEQEKPKHKGRRKLEMD